MHTHFAGSPAAQRRSSVSGLSAAVMSEFFRKFSRYDRDSVSDDRLVCGVVIDDDGTRGLQADWRVSLEWISVIHCRGKLGV
jgi:hypothetical protein